MSSTFLTPKEVAELTGVYRSAKGRSREQLQVAALNTMKVPHFVNPAGRPVVVRAVIEGGRQEVQVATWEPSLA